MTSDVELLSAWRSGDNAAGNELFERHFDSIRRFFQSKLGDNVEDLIQKTFLACVESHENIEQPDRFKAYLFTIARNELFMYLRRNYRTPEIDRFEDRPIEGIGPSPSTMLRQRREQDLLLQALRRIPLSLQIILELYYWEDMKGPELAVALEIPLGTVKSRLRRAREALDGALAELAADPELLESTVANLEQWARSLREALVAPEGDN